MSSTTAPTSEAGGNTIHVSNIAHNASEKTVRDFFSFCGKIQNISITPTTSEAQAPLSATVTFEKATAAKTALLLDNSVLDGTPIHVEAASSLDDLSHQAEEDQANQDELRQEDKPRTTILAEYLAHGYHVGDVAIQRGIELDDKHGITSRFNSYLQNLDNRFKVTDKTRAVDNTYGVTDKANQGYNTVFRYFESALNTPTGQKVRSFYTKGQKQVLDIHNEARRIADLKAPAPSGEAGSTSASGTGSSEKIKQPEVVGEKATHCTCGGAEGVCGCKPGECTCAGCAKPGPEKWA